MSAPIPTKPNKPRSHFNNWISAAGAVLAVGALFSFALLVWVDFTSGDKNPYLGIFTYIVAPGFLITGLVAVFGGAWLQRRYAIKYAGAPERWQLRFEDPRQRRFIILFSVGGILFLLLSVFGSYETYHYSESVQFCGQVCHRAMNPEFVAYQRGAHARVDCVDCHIGSGAEWFIKAKINGTHQLIAYTLNNYNRPIATPIKNLRPAQDICEKCHWPEKFHGNIDVNFDHYLSDKGNTPPATNPQHQPHQSLRRDFRAKMHPPPPLCEWLPHQKAVPQRFRKPEIATKKRPPDSGGRSMAWNNPVTTECSRPAPQPGCRWHRLTAVASSTSLPWSGSGHSACCCHPPSDRFPKQYSVRCLGNR